MKLFDKSTAAPFRIPLLNQLAILFVVGGMFATVWGASIWQDSRKTKQVKRVARPNFQLMDQDRIYFADVFRDGLIGEYPGNLSAVADTTGDLAFGQVTAGNDVATMVTESILEASWSPLISAETIENEIKAIHARLASEITTPIQFRSNYIQSHRGFSMLSTMFAIIHHYENEVRWKSEAGAAQVSFWQAAANARVGSPQAFESCRKRLDLLTDMIRGGKFAGDEKPQEDFDWSRVVDRNPLMHRLETSMEVLKTSTSNQKEFEKQQVAIKHEAELVAAIALVLIQEYMTDADADDYREYANQMQQFASSLNQAIEANQLSIVQQAVNQINQTCVSCHSDWK